MARLWRAGIALAIVAGVIPQAATARHTCASDVSIVSRFHANPAADEPSGNAHELAVCPSGANTDPVDTRTIQPGANQVQVLFAPDTPPQPGATVTATLTGLLNQSITLTFKPNVVGLYRYASDWLAFPMGAAGTLKATVGSDSSTDSTTYHTVN